MLHFGDSRSLSDREFMEIFGADLAATIGDLRAKDVDKFTADVRRIGEALAERRVPFPEIVVSMHLFEESATTAFPSFPPMMPKIYLAFDKLSHCRMIVLADAYFRSTAAVANARIRAWNGKRHCCRARRAAASMGWSGKPAMRQLYDASRRSRGPAARSDRRRKRHRQGTGRPGDSRMWPRAAASPFVALNCAAMPNELIESELFGYKRGAFSGATAEYLGLFRAAEGGTLFLDEITEMSPDTQSKLLRAIQEQMVRPVGASPRSPSMCA